MNSEEFAAALHKLTLHEQSGTVDEDDVTENLAQRDGDKGDDNVGAHQAEGDGDGTAENGEKGKESHPGTTASQETMSLVEVFFLDVQVFLYPLHLTHAAYTVVDDAAKYVADGAVDHQDPGVETCSYQSHHHSFAGEGEETASEEGGQ